MRLSSEGRPSQKSEAEVHEDRPNDDHAGEDKEGEEEEKGKEQLERRVEDIVGPLVRRPAHAKPEVVKC